MGLTNYQERLIFVQHLLKDNNFLLGTNRAVNCVVRALKLSMDQAHKFIISELGKLSEENFANSTWMNDCIYDVYGKRIHNIPWYIKFGILKDDNGDFVHNISFHPTESELKTASEVLETYTD